MRIFENCIFNNTVTVAEDASFDNCSFKVRGTSKKDANTVGVVVSGAANAVIKNSEFANMGYSAIGVRSSGKVVIDSNVFDCGDVYNPIEGTVSAGSEVKDVVIKHNTFNGICGNNYINFYKMADGANVVIENNEVTGASSDSEILRLSNPANNEATFTVRNNRYTFVNGDESDYTAFIMCQDYTNKSGNKQDFSKYTVNIENLTCNGETMMADKPAQGKLFFVYEDGKGIIEDNNPNIVLK